MQRGALPDTLPDNPYTYPGTDVLRNRFDIRDSASLEKHERLSSRGRATAAMSVSFPLTADGYRALHKHLFDGVYDWAGKDRTTPLGKPGADFATPPYIGTGLDAAFKSLQEQKAFHGLPRSEFFDRLGNHINELNAVHPFREGNGRTMRANAHQVAREAGHPIDAEKINAHEWMEASRHGFKTGDYRPLANVLSDAALSRELGPEPRIGPAGIALLPVREPPTEQRYRLTLTRAQEELVKHLPDARREAAQRLRGAVENNLSSDKIVAARTELAYVRHAKGPIYQAQLLRYLGTNGIDAVVSPKQTALDRVREIGAAISVQINMSQNTSLQRAVRNLENSVSAPGTSPPRDRLAGAFLKNTPEQNKADPRFAPAQAIVDQVMGAARSRGDNQRTVKAAGEAARKNIAERMRYGQPIDAKPPAFENKGPALPTPPTQTKDRSR